MGQDVYTRVTEEDARRRAATPLRSSSAEGAISIADSIEVELTGPATEVEIADGSLAADNNDMRVLTPGAQSIEDTLRPTNGHETIAVSIRFKTAGDSVNVSVVGYVTTRQDGALTRLSLQEETATATARFDDDGFWSVDLLFPSGGAQLYQVRLEAPADLVKVFTWTF
ncbi:hypothetical protein LCGC14_0724280 [marine sediment metagenome]|uniref:Uncharacterized protein n=1 Tax=marine sediment metagenome TaxID=412755 RepID=A0A0F9SWS5_9ZZZZ